MIKISALRLKAKVFTQAQAPIYDKVHTSSVMFYPPPGHTFTLDPGFGFYGPMELSKGYLFPIYYKFMYQKVEITMVTNILSGYCNRCSFSGVGFVRNF